MRLASSTNSSLNTAERAVLAIDEEMDSLMISKQDRQALLDFGSVVGIMYFIYILINFFVISYQEADFKKYMLKHIYPESAEQNVKVCCWKTTDDALEYECN